MAAKRSGRIHWPKVTRATMTYLAGLYILLYEVPHVAGNAQIGLIGAGLYCLGLPSAWALNGVLHGSAPRIVIGRYSEQHQDQHQDPSAGDESSPEVPPQ